LVLGERVYQQGSARAVGSDDEDGLVHFYVAESAVKYLIHCEPKAMDGF